MCTSPTPVGSAGVAPLEAEDGGVGLLLRLERLHAEVDGGPHRAARRGSSSSGTADGEDGGPGEDGGRWAGRGG